MTLREQERSLIKPDEHMRIIFHHGFTTILGDRIRALADQEKISWEEAYQLLIKEEIEENRLDGEKLGWGKAIT